MKFRALSSIGESWQGGASRKERTDACGVYAAARPALVIRPGSRVERRSNPADRGSSPWGRTILYAEVAQLAERVKSSRVSRGRTFDPFPPRHLQTSQQSETFICDSHLTKYTHRFHVKDSRSFLRRCMVSKIFTAIVDINHSAPRPFTISTRIKFNTFEWTLTAAHNQTLPPTLEIAAHVAKTNVVEIEKQFDGVWFMQPRFNMVNRKIIHGSNQFSTTYTCSHTGFYCQHIKQHFPQTITGRTD